ncbi:Holliday junction resolvase RuvX [Actimicrobium sp. GrIS 1.19]|uniref:Holliday junction resolvase RuvX n=1 Tax=Actimicrobium sp. GrIS 1.19 TaxID=3071708 RepID=UPI002E122579
METILAFDFGLKRIGVAVGNTLIRQAQPLSIIDAPTNDGKFAAIAALVAAWQPGRCVVGIPLHPDGAEHEMTVRCRRFANQLQGRYDVPTVLVDERYSSAVLSQQRGERIDDRAAALILQQYFDDLDFTDLDGDLDAHT